MKQQPAEDAGWTSPLQHSALDPDFAFPGHGRLVSDVGRFVAERRARGPAAGRGRRARRAKALLVLPARDRDLPPAVATGFLGLSQAIGYLEALVAQERATAEVLDGVRLYNHPV